MYMYISSLNLFEKR